MPISAATTSMSRLSSSSTARIVRSGSSAAAEDHSSDPAPTPRYLASAQGEARPVASARPGSGRSRFASHRRRIRLEARGQARAALRPHDSVQHSSPPRVEAVEKLRCGTAVARWAFEAGGPATLRRSARYEVTRTGDVRQKPRKERELLGPFPKVYLRLAVRMAPPCVSRAELSRVVGSAALTTPPVSRARPREVDSSRARTQTARGV